MIRKKTVPKEFVIDLTGSSGNAFSLLAYTKVFARQIGVDPVPIMSDMRSGNYEHQLQVFDDNFGGLVVLER